MFTYSKNFWIVCVGMFLFMTSFNLILPELNSLLTKQGGEKYLGLILVLFTLSSAIARPFSGKLSDIVGRKLVMLIGIAISIITTILYPIFGGISIFLALRFIHGFSVGFLPTGATALMTDILKPEHRGSGMGIWGTFISLGIGVGWSLSSYAVYFFGVNGMFVISVLLGVAAAYMFTLVEETLPQKLRFKLSQMKLGWTEIFEPRVIPSAIVTFLSAFCSGVIFVLTPEHVKFLSIENKGLFFTFYVGCTIFVRLFTGKLSDKYGRRKMILIGMVIMAFSMYMIATCENIYEFIFSSILFGLATGIVSPTIFAWTADLSLPNRRGIGAGTMFIALELGIMAGAAMTLLIYDKTWLSITHSFLIAMLMCIVSIVYLTLHLIFKGKTEIKSY